MTATRSTFPAFCCFSEQVARAEDARRSQQEELERLKQEAGAKVEIVIVQVLSHVVCRDEGFNKWW